MMVEPWILFTLAAATFQTGRFMVQKHLSDTGLSGAGATFARFAFAAPVAGALLAVVMWQTGQALPALGPLFWFYVLMAATGQVMATLCVMALFKRRNFAVGITLKKSEVLQSALIGLIILGDALSGWGLLALVTGFVALLILSDARSDAPAVSGWRRFATASAALGLAAGVFFAFAGVGVRGATLQVADVSTGLRALVTLVAVTSVQMLGMLAWFALRDRAQPVKVLRAWRAVSLTGALSLAGSFCWFAAFSLQTAAYVYALGQVEVLLSMAAGAWMFGERLRRAEVVGIALLMASLIILILAG